MLYFLTLFCLTVERLCLRTHLTSLSMCILKTYRNCLTDLKQNYIITQRNQLMSDLRAESLVMSSQLRYNLKLFSGTVTTRQVASLLTVQKTVSGIRPTCKCAYSCDESRTTDMLSEPRDPIVYIGTPENEHVRRAKHAKTFFI